jgi:dipeptidyl aminopeptidase/acylaminoacyl peptidase
MESGGATPNGMAQSLCDLNDCLNAIKADERFAGLDISVMGHSWGGFSTLNISALHPDISHVVVLSGFVSAEELTNTFFSGIMKGYRKAILALEREANPVFVKYHAVESLKSSNAKILLIYSDNDTLCRKNHYDILKSGLADKANVEFMLVEGKGHNPNYTADAVKYLGEFVKARAKFNKKSTAEDKAKFVASFDWERMTAQDSDVWKRIFDTLDA